MFLLKLYRFNKLAFFAFISFITAYIFLNYKWGLVATPIYQFGMYSGIEHTSGEYKTYAITVNDQQLNLNDFSAPQLDAMLIPIKHFKAQKENNAAVYKVFTNVFSKAGISGILKDANFDNNITDGEFTHWYLRSLSKILNYTVNSFQITSRNHLWQSDHFVPVHSSKIEFADVK